MVYLNTHNVPPYRRPACPLISPPLSGASFSGAPRTGPLHRYRFVEGWGGVSKLKVKVNCQHEINHLCTLIYLPVLASKHSRAQAQQYDSWGYPLKDVEHGLSTGVRRGWLRCYLRGSWCCQTASSRLAEQGKGLAHYLFWGLVIDLQNR